MIVTSAEKMPWLMTQKKSTGWRRVMLLCVVPMLRNAVPMSAPMTMFWRSMVAMRAGRRRASRMQRLQAGQWQPGWAQGVCPEDLQVWGS